MLRSIFILGIFFCLSVCNSFAAAQDDFQSGLQAFKNKQYPQAIRLFDRARQQGMKTPALYYNLAVSYFKTGNYTQAKIWFNNASQYKKIKYLSEYNLGLVAIKQGDNKTALGHFKRVSKHAREENLVKLANYQISQLYQKSPKSWSAFAQVKYGHDDNVTTAIDSSPTKQASDYMDLYAYGSATVSGTPKQGLMMNAYVLDTRYTSSGQNDMQVRSLGLTRTFAPGKWRNAVGIDYQNTTLDGQNFQDSINFEARTLYNLSSESNLRLRYRYYDINSKPPYTELSGNKQRLRLEYRWYPGADTLKLYYEYETNDRNEASTTTSSYSPTRHTLRGAYTYAFSDKLALTGDLAYRISDYPAKTYTNPTPPPNSLTKAGREDTRVKANLELAYYLNRIWFLTAEYNYTNNDSDDPVYRYKRKISSISINASF